MSVRRYLAEHALIDSVWTRDVLIEVDASGEIASITANAEAGDAERIAGCVVPGMPNLHSHAFQRAMAGLTEKGGPSHDSFWSWREQMYVFLQRLTPDDIEAIATRLYIEMLEAGYTTVAEFHYLHHDAKGAAYSQAGEISQRLIAAAKTAGIGLTLLPVFYAHSQFGGEPPTAGQRRFIHGVDEFNRLVSDLHAQLAHEPMMRLGIAPHSLRAVTPHELAAIVAHFESLDATGPIHIHAAEQRKEVDDSLSWSGKRPVEWLLEHAMLDSRWCLIHATHMEIDEVNGLAASGAVAGLCPSTEADLGDGFFDAPEFSQPAVRSVSAATATSASILSSNCGCSNMGKGCVRRSATCSPAKPAHRSAKRCIGARQAAARKRLVNASALCKMAIAPTGS
jgi:formimidoylglutamate deiminase